MTRCPHGQGFLTRANAEAYAHHTDRAKTPYLCACGKWHVRKRTPEEIAEMAKRSEAERKARVAAHLSTVPERSRDA